MVFFFNLKSILKLKSQLNMSRPQKKYVYQPDVEYTIDSFQDITNEDFFFEVAIQKDLNGQDLGDCAETDSIKSPPPSEKMLAK